MIRYWGQGGRGQGFGFTLQPGGDLSGETRRLFDYTELNLNKQSPLKGGRPLRGWGGGFRAHSRACWVSGAGTEAAAPGFSGSGQAEVPAVLSGS